MAWIVEVRGPDCLPLGGSSPDEQYGLGEWGPALFGPNNVTELSDAAASSFQDEGAARVLLLLLVFGSHGANQFRHREDA